MRSNEVALTATLAALDAPRTTPAGIPVARAKLKHASDVDEAGSKRRVEFEIDAVALGALASKLQRCGAGSDLRLRGFLAPRRKDSPILVLHLTDIDTQD